MRRASRPPSTREPTLDPVTDNPPDPVVREILTAKERSLPLPEPGEHKTVQARILKYEQERLDVTQLVSKRVRAAGPANVGSLCRFVGEDGIRRWS